MSEPSHGVLLVGGTSEIRLAIVRRLASDRPTRACVLGRDQARLEQAAADRDQAGCPDAVVDSPTPTMARSWGAEATVRALAGRAHTIWVPARLRVIFTAMRHLPRPIHRRLPL